MAAKGSSISIFTPLMALAFNAIPPSPNAALGGNVTLGDEVHVGLGAVVIENVPEDVTVAGVPARRLRTPRTIARRGSSEGQAAASRGARND